MRTYLQAFCMTAVAMSSIPLVLSGIAQNALADPSKSKEAGVHQQGDETEIYWKKVKTCVFKIDGSQWKSQIGNPNIPEQYQTDATRLKAKDALLVISISIVNKGNAAVRTGGFDMAPPVFRLTNGQGQLFAPVDQNPAVQQDNLTMKFWMGANVNPGGTLSGTVVFDVPKGDYVLVTYNSKMEGNSFQPANELFRHKLEPSEEQQSKQQ